MHRRGVAWLLAGAALLVCPTAAYGSLDAALKTFGGTWPQGCPQVTIEQGSDPDPTVSGFATPGTCVIYLTPTFLAQSPHPESVCAVVVHEFGHLLGLGHSGNESNIMFPSPLPPPACLEASATATATATAAQAPEPVRVPAIDSIASSAQPTTGRELLRPSTRAKRRTGRRACLRARSRARVARSARRHCRA